MNGNECQWWSHPTCDGRGCSQAIGPCESVVEGANWVGGWEKKQIVDLEKAIDYGSDKEKIIVDTIGCVKEGEFYKRGGRSGSKVEDVDATGFFWVFLGCFLDQIRLQ